MGTKRQQALRAYRAFLNRNEVFTLSDLSAVAGGRDPRRTALERIKYHASTGRLKSLARELYAVVPSGTDPEDFSPDPFLVARALRSDALFCHHSALELLGAGHSDWNACTAFTAGKPSVLVLRSASVRLLRAPIASLGTRWSTLGVRDVGYRGRRLRVTGPERTLVEGFRQPRWAGGLSELVESAAGFASLDLDLLRQVLEAYDQRSLWAAVGWFLERFAREFHVAPAVLDEFARHRPRGRQYLLRGERGGVLAPRWNLLLPESLVSGGDPDEPVA